VLAGLVVSGELKNWAKCKSCPWANAVITRLQTILK
jgi:hypothetical protein